MNIRYYFTLLFLLVMASAGRAGTSLNYLDAEFQETGNKVVIRWQTLAEVNCREFHIERSQDGLNWVNIGTVNGNGNSGVPVDYVWEDTLPQAGTSYYRLSSWDYDGTPTWFTPVSVAVAYSQTEELFVYYNQGLRDIRVEFYSTIDRPNSILNVMDGHGRLVLTDVINIVKGKTLWVYKEDNPVTNMYIGTLRCVNGDNFLKKVLIID